jgi:hypothetical protein
MAEVIKLVKNDTYPFVRVTLLNSLDDTPINVADGGTVVRVYFRAVGSTTLLSTLTCTKPNGGTDGVVQFNFPDPTLDVAPGLYEGEVEITYTSGDKQTVYDVLKFKLRDEFA